MARAASLALMLVLLALAAGGAGPGAQGPGWSLAQATPEAAGGAPDPAAPAPVAGPRVPVAEAPRLWPHQERATILRAPASVRARAPPARAA